MAFKVNDLMITVLPARDMLLDFGIIGGKGCYCSHCTENCSNCSCSRCTHNCTVSAVDFETVSYPPDLAILRERLKMALAEVEAAERVAQESLRPQTVSDVELLEQKLTAALNELQVQKADLQKRASEG